MRLSTDGDRDEDRGSETIAAAIEAGITVFDTAHAYARDDSDLGHNERLLGTALRRLEVTGTARIITKGGMSRSSGGWQPDGRAGTLRRDCEASLVALGGLPIDLYLVHAPDPRVPWSTTLRALGSIADQAVVGGVGVCNVNRRQLDEAVDTAPIAAVQVPLNLFDDRAVRGGVVQRCAELGIAVIAHSPLGGPRRVSRLLRDERLRDSAERHQATAGEVALAWLLGLAPNIVVIPGARRPETARSAARAAGILLDTQEQQVLTTGFGRVQAVPRAAQRPRASGGQIAVVMGIPAAGKSRIAQAYVERGYLRLNRDERGGSLLAVAEALDDALAGGASDVVLDNTYLTRASRSHVLEVAGAHDVRTRCVWVDTPLDQAQVNLVQRLLDGFGSLPTPEQLRRLSRQRAGLLSPTQQMRAVRELEPPASEEGWSRIEHVPFVRAPTSGVTAAGVFVATAVLAQPRWRAVVAAAEPAAPHLLFDWRAGASSDDLRPAVAELGSVVVGPVEAALCPHPAGPPTCWCRPPLPGLPLAFAHSRGLDPARCTVIGCTPTHRRMASTLGARYLQP